jgi:hypothetical protein
LALATTTSDPVTPMLEVSGDTAISALSAGAAQDLVQSARGDVMHTDLRSVLSSADRDYSPGPLAGVKRGATSDPGYPQPQAAEIESARLLANDARRTLLAAGFSDQDIDRLADDFIAEDRGQDTEEFIDWARRIQRAADRAAPDSV